MKILITGAAGFIGSHTVEFLERHGNKVMAVDNFSTGKPENIKKFRGHVVPCDITDQYLLERTFYDFQPDAVLHLAAQSAITTAWSDPIKDLNSNGIGTLTLLMSAIKYKVRRFVFASSSAVYYEKTPFGGITESWQCKPSNPYGISKLACEQYIRCLFPNHMILRYGNVYGPRQVAIGENQVIARAFSHFVKGTDFKVDGHGNQKRDFVYVDDIVYANTDALTSKARGTFNVATGKSLSVNQVLAMIEKVYEVSGYRWEHTHVNDPRGNVHLNCNYINLKLGWRANRSIYEGIVATKRWWDEYK